MPIPFYTLFTGSVGGDPFSPSIKANSIILDNSVETEAIGAVGSGDTTLKKTNGIFIDFTISSKQNNLDGWIQDVDYLKYMTISFYVLNSNSQLKALENALSAYNINILQNFNNSDSVKLTKVPLIDIVELDETTEKNYTFTTQYTKTFKELSSDEDIILVVLPAIDFRSYFSDNGIDEKVAISLIKSFYKYEYHVYNILINNKTINDSDSRKILSDVRQINELKINLLSLLPPAKDIPSYQVDKVDYVSDVFSSFDYSNKTINNYFFFNVINFINDNCALKKKIKDLSSEEINNTLINNNSIFVEIFREDEQQLISICSFNCGTTQINNSSIASTINSFNNNDLLCILFTDIFPNSNKCSFKYKIDISYVDPFINGYYNTNNDSSTGIYFNILSNQTEVQSYVDDPRNSDSKTNKFVKVEGSNAPTVQKNQMVSEFFAIYNLFSQKQLSNDKVNNIAATLDFQKSNVVMYNDFFNFMNIYMPQFEDYFTSYAMVKTSYSKNSTSKKLDIKDFYFSKNASDYTKINFYNEYDTSNKVLSYDLTTGSIDMNNPISYKIINSVLNLTNDQSSYSSTTSYIDNLLNFEGTTIEYSTDKKSNKRTISLFSDSNSTNPTLQKPSNVKVDAKEQVNLASFGELINDIIATTSDFARLKFLLYFLDDISKDSLVPNISTNVYDTKTKQWKDINSVVSKLTNTTYLAKTIYNKENNIFSKNNIIPPINEEYFILQISGKLGSKTIKRIGQNNE